MCLARKNLLHKIFALKLGRKNQRRSLAAIAPLLIAESP